MVTRATCEEVSTLAWFQPAFVAGVVRSRDAEREPLTFLGHVGGFGIRCAGQPVGPVAILHPHLHVVAGHAGGIIRGAPRDGDGRGAAVDAARMTVNVLVPTFVARSVAVTRKVEWKSGRLVRLSTPLP